VIYIGLHSRFHTYDYARHFVSACTRILGLEGTPDGVEDRGKLTRVAAVYLHILISFSNSIHRTAKAGISSCVVCLSALNNYTNEYVVSNFLLMMTMFYFLGV